MAKTTLKIIFAACIFAIQISTPAFSSEIERGNGNDTGIIISDTDESAARPALVGLKDGSLYVAWQHMTDSPAPSDVPLTVSVQHINQRGNPSFDPKGLDVSDLAPGTRQTDPVIVETHTGVIIVWVDNRSGSESIYAQHVLSSGRLAWGPVGIPVADDYQRQHQIKAVTDGHNGVIIVWEDLRSMTQDLYAQRIDGRGNLLWGNGVLVAGAPHGQIHASLASDGHGGAVIGWHDNRDSGDGYGWDIYVNKIDSDGVVAFGSSGVAACRLQGLQYYAQVVPDQHNGVIVVWRDSRVMSAPQLYGNRIDEYGNLLWGDTGTNLSNSDLYVGTIDVVENNDDGVYVAWSEHKGLVGTVYLDSIDNNGASLWHWPRRLSARQNETADSYPRLVKTNGDWVYAVWGSWDGFNQSLDAQLIDHRGRQLWQLGGISVAKGQFFGSPHIATLTKNFNLVTIWVWEKDDGDEGNGNIHAQMIDRRGRKLW